MMFHVFFLMIRRPPRSTRTDTLCPYTTLFRSDPKRSFAASDTGVNRLTNVPSGSRNCAVRLCRYLSHVDRLVRVTRWKFSMIRSVTHWRPCAADGRSGAFLKRAVSSLSLDMIHISVPFKHCDVHVSVELLSIPL